MTHPHSDQRNTPVLPRHPALSPYAHLVNAPVFPLESPTSALIPTHDKQPLVVDGEILTSNVTIPAPRWHDTDPTHTGEPKRSLLRRAVDDPYWILMTLTIALSISITATVVYGVVQITLAVAHWLTMNGPTLAAITIVAVAAVMVCAGATVATCAGIHCRGCQG